MYQIFRKRVCSDPLPRLTLEGLWRVDADLTYHIRPAKVWPDSTRIAIRTEKGHGSLQTADGTRFLLRENTLIFLKAGEIREYWTDEAPWKFYWLEFRLETPFSLPEKEILSIPVSASEQDQLRECCQNLGSTRPENSLLSQADFLRLVLFWLNAENGTGTEPVAILERGGRLNRSIPEMAREAGMCQRSFRSEIHRLTGCSPVEYLTRLRMDTAMEMLCSTDMTLQEIADSLHYGNVFYFSRVFRQHFGMAPGIWMKSSCITTRMGGRSHDDFQA